MTRVQFALPVENSVAAHLILGSRAEPFLAPLLESLVGVADTLIVNDNARGDSPHDRTLNESWFGRNERAIIDRTPFTDFASARNICLRIHRERAGGGWVVFVDADEVHGPQARQVAHNLGRVPREIDFIDGYTWHFFQSFDYYTSIERRMMFFRFTPEVRWEGHVHEHLLGLHGRRIALPYVYAHYGHTLEPRRHAEKGRLYSGLGAPGGVLAESELETFDVEEYFAVVYPRLLRFGGAHPPHARAAIERLGPALAPFHALTATQVANQPLRIRMKNALMKLNYEQRWRARALDPLARRLLSPPPLVPESSS
ncbi:MAG: hypothetical protein ACXWNK_12715 [Vulcanimicrobiaceae bacterium]